MSEFHTKVKTATRWAAITEVVVRLVAPVTSLVLARLLTPEAFGVVTTLTMIITFAELFADAGFQKYLIQHEFANDVDREQSTNVAFWSNFVTSLLIWGAIALFAEPLSASVGNPGLGMVLVVACVSIPLEAFSSIQMALYKRDLDFKTLFKVRLAGILIPLCVTVPLAFWLRSYWALVWGTIAKDSVNALLLTVYSRWKPSFYYSFNKLKEMLSFTIWSLIEAISIWLTCYVDVFIVGTMLSQHYLGLYKTATTLVGAIVSLITSATTPVLFSSLSRLQNDAEAFRRLFFKFQKLVSLLIIPVGVGLFCYSDTVTEILLGTQWMEASGFVGLWGLTSAITIVLAHYSGEVYRAMGRPKLSVLAQWLHIVVLWPTVIIAVRYGFETLYVARSLIRFELVLVNLFIIYYLVHISVWEMIRNILPACCAAMGMYVTCQLLSFLMGESVGWQIASMVPVAAIYAGIILLFPKERKLIQQTLLKR